MMDVTMGTLISNEVLEQLGFIHNPDTHKNTYSNGHAYYEHPAYDAIFWNDAAGIGIEWMVQAEAENDSVLMALEDTCDGGWMRNGHLIRIATVGDVVRAFSPDLKLQWHFASFGLYPSAGLTSPAAIELPVLDTTD